MQGARPRLRWARAAGIAAVAAGTMISGTACGTPTSSGTGQPAPESSAPRLGSPAVSQDEIHRGLRELESSYRARIGAFALDTATGRTVTHRATERFP